MPVRRRSMSVPPPADALLPVAAADSAPDLEAAFLAHYGRVARTLARIVRDRARAEELAVDVFLKWSRRGLPGWPNEAGGIGWLLKTAVRTGLTPAADPARPLRAHRRDIPLGAAHSGGRSRSGRRTATGAICPCRPPPTRRRTADAAQPGPAVRRSRRDPPHQPCVDRHAHRSCPATLQEGVRTTLWTPIVIRTRPDGSTARSQCRSSIWTGSLTPARPCCAIAPGDPRRAPGHNAGRGQPPPSPLSR